MGSDRRAYKRAWYAKNREDEVARARERRKTEEYKAYRRRYRDENRQKINEQAKKDTARAKLKPGYIPPHIKYKETLCNYRRNNLEKIRQYRREYMAKLREKPEYRLICCIRTCIHNALKMKACEKTGHLFNQLGYTVDQLIEHLSKFYNKPCEICKQVIISENPRNYEIDHKIPIMSGFTYTEILDLNKLTNLRLLCETCNAKKSKADRLFIKLKKRSRIVQDNP